MEAALDRKIKACVMTAVPDNICELFSKRSERYRSVREGDRETARGRLGLLSLRSKRTRAKSLRVRTSNGATKAARMMYANFDYWARQAKDAEWRVPRSFQTLKHTPELTGEQRNPAGLRDRAAAFGRKA